MREAECAKRCVGLVTAIKAASSAISETNSWREDLDALIGDLAVSDTMDIIMYLGGMINGLIDTICENVPSFANVEPAQYLQILGHLAAVDPNQGTFDFPE